MLVFGAKHAVPPPFSRLLLSIHSLPFSDSTISNKFKGRDGIGRLARSEFEVELSQPPIAGQGDVRWGTAPIVLNKKSVTPTRVLFLLSSFSIFCFVFALYRPCAGLVPALFHTFSSSYAFRSIQGIGTIVTAFVLPQCLVPALVLALAP